MDWIDDIIDFLPQAVLIVAVVILVLHGLGYI